MKEWKIFVVFLVIFLAAFVLPVESLRFQNGLVEGFALLKEYARQHVLLCLVPAFFIAGAISVFVSKESVIKYFGAKAKKIVSYSIASISGSVLAVCSCTVLPLFAGIYTRGCWDRTGFSFSLLRTGHQCPSHHLDRQSLGCQTGFGPGRRSCRLCCGHRALHACHTFVKRKARETRKTLFLLKMLVLKDRYGKTPFFSAL